MFHALVVIINSRRWSLFAKLLVTVLALLTDLFIGFRPNFAFVRRSLAGLDMCSSIGLRFKVCVDMMAHFTSLIV